MYYAHSSRDHHEAAWQSAQSHLINTAEKSAAYAEIFGASKAAYLCGLLHDIGKYNPSFLAYIRGHGTSSAKGPDHSTDGAAILLQESQTATGPDKIILELLSHAVAGHHAGLPDRMPSTDMPSGRSLEDRIADWAEARLDSVWHDEVHPEYSNLFPEGFVADKRRSNATTGDPAKAFQLAFLGRMIFSCLVDADFKDTEAYYAKTEQRTVDRRWPELGSQLTELRTRFKSHMNAMVKRPNPLTQVRSDILSGVLSKAQQTPGIFTLNVPTGGGKTLASLGFALEHAAAHGKRRIIYSIPFTSIIDQTARVFREVLGDNVILEHHSAIEEASVVDRQQRDKLKLAMEDWAASVVVTTNVQFFESLFSNRPSRCRKLHNIAGSVIILDEAQTLPLDLLKPAVMALDELVRNYGCSIVLCTATQPALNRNDYPQHSLMGLEIEGRELAPNPNQLTKDLRRASIQCVGPLSDEDLVNNLTKTKSALVIVNSRKHALDLYNSAKAAELPGLIHLSTRQCAAHRQRLLGDIRDRLTDEENCRVVATSLIEAGVDVDFPSVYRAEAGLEQILQAAGRCNREGRQAPEDSPVIVFSPTAHTPPRELAQAAEAFKYIASRHDDLFSREAINDYFKQCYWQRGSGLDKENILGMAKVAKTGTNIAYRSIADAFRMIKSGMVPVIIPYDDFAGDWIAKLALEDVPSGLIARKLQRYVVQIPPKARMLLIDNGFVKFKAPKLRGDQFAILEAADELYSEQLGLLWENADYLSVENCII